MTSFAPSAGFSFCALSAGIFLCVAHAQISDKKDKAAQQRKLNQTISIPLDIRDVPLIQFLEQMSKRYTATFELRINDFEDRGIRDIDKEPVRLRAQKSITLSDALKTALKPLNATCFADDDCITIVPLAPSKR